MAAAGNSPGSARLAVFRFGECVFEAGTRQLRRSGAVVELTPRAFDLLGVLLEQRPRVVAKEELSSRLWPGNAIGDTSLAKLVSEIRQAIGDDPREPRFIRTVHRHGYAFCGHVLGGQPEAAGGVLLDTHSPYPGLRAFTDADADVFFGRGEEAQKLWRKLEHRRLVALIGPSGVGKTSFVRAGLIASRPAGWSAAYMTPGANPVSALARGLTSQLISDPEGMTELLEAVGSPTASEGNEHLVAAVRRWRCRTAEALLVVDQFEELFTQHPPDARARFACLLGRLVEQGVHVLLSLRDDFLFRCSEYPALVEVFNDLTPLTPPSAQALERALVAPAAREGVRFEEDALVREMVEVVSGERGALPLLAFAVSRLWEERDRERRLLTREAYERIGGVAGALARHAEATLERIGAERKALVRDLFRNLVTAQGTRATRARQELVSIFTNRPTQRADAEAVLNALVDARLLTSYEREEDQGESRQHLEIVHESLLTHWPRLVRWQTQDADGALLRDQLRQAAQLWQDRGRPAELLWSGAAYRDFALWRERHPGGLTTTEQGFAEAATKLAGRRRRHRTIAVAAALAVAALVTAGVLGLWHRSEVSRAKAEAAALQREAAELLALGRLRLDDYPSAAVAYAIASLERADSGPARRFAVEALWKGPTAHVDADGVVPISVLWSDDGRWLALGGMYGLALLDRDGGKRLRLAAVAEVPVGFSRDGTRLVTETSAGTSALHVWSVPAGQLLASWPHATNMAAILIDRRLLTFSFDGRPPATVLTAAVEERSIDGGPVRPLGLWRTRGLSDWGVDSAGERLFSVQGGRLVEQRLEALDASARTLGRHEGKVSVRSRSWPGQVVTADAGGEIRLWDTATGRVARVLRCSASALSVTLDPRGRYLATAPGGPLPPNAFSLFDLEAPEFVEPTTLLQEEQAWLNSMAFHPDGRWLASAQAGSVLLWNLAGRRSRVLRGHKGVAIALTFTRDGRLVATSDEGFVRVWPFGSAPDDPVRVLWSAKNPLVGYFIEVDRESRFAVIANRFQGQIVTVPLDGSPARVYQARLVRGRPAIGRPAIDPGGRRVAFRYAEIGNPDAASVRVLDLTTGVEQTLRAPTTAGACEDVASAGALDEAAWLPNGTLVSDGATGLRLWDLPSGSSRQLRPCWTTTQTVRTGGRWLLPTPDSRALVRLSSPGSTDAAPSHLSIVDLETGASRDIKSHGTRVAAIAMDANAAVLITGGADGLVRIGPLTGEEPHLLYGHSRAVTSVAVSPDGRWIASGSDDDTIRLWPMPEGAPLHKLPYGELLPRLRSLTNLRVVPDASSATGYKVAPGPFPGWAEAHEW